MTEDWSQEEVGLIIADYFSMFEKERLHQPLNKQHIETPSCRSCSVVLPAP